MEPKSRKRVHFRDESLESSVYVAEKHSDEDFEEKKADERVSQVQSITQKINVKKSNTSAGFTKAGFNKTTKKVMPTVNQTIQQRPPWRIGMAKKTSQTSE